jgi:heptosyltransferase-2
VLALPALERAAELAGPDGLVVHVTEQLAPLVAMAGIRAELLPLRGRHRVLRAVRELRARRPEAGVLLTPSFSAALILRLAGVPARRGTSTDRRGWLLTDPVDRRPLLSGHRVAEYLRLVDSAVTGDAAVAPRLEVREEARRAWAEVARAKGLEGTGPLLGLVPGSAASSRRWPAERFGEVARRRMRAGDEVVIFGGPGDAPLARAVNAEAPGAHDLAGRTSLAALIGGLGACRAVVANDTGPMHVAAALGRPVVAIFGAGDPGQTAPLSTGAVVVRRELPCAPCLRNRCPRRGRGYMLEEASLECLRLVTVDDVEEALMRVVGDGGEPRREGGDHGG